MKKLKLLRVLDFVGSLLNSPVNLFYRARRKPMKPRLVNFSVIETCNSKCLHCDIWKNEEKDPPLSPFEIESIFSNPLFSRVKYVICTGGEATIRKDLIDVFRALNRALPKATLQLSTNGLLPKRVIETVETLLGEGIKLDVGISIDGLQGDHDRLRGVKGNFVKADRLIDDLLAIRGRRQETITVAVGVVVSNETRNQVKDVRNYAKEKGIKMVEAWYNESSFYNNSGRPGNSNELIDIVASQPISPIRGKWLDYLKGRSIAYRCFALQSFFVLKANGDIAPCLNYWDDVAGNLRTQKPEEIWRGESAHKIRGKVIRCEGCLNDWCYYESIRSSFYPLLKFGLRHPMTTFKSLVNGPT